MSKINKKEKAAALYIEEKVSLAKAASMAGVSITRMKQILMQKGINPRLGVEDANGLKEDYKTVKRSRKLII